MIEFAGLQAASQCELLGLRRADAVAFHLLHFGLGVVLVFVGVKLVLPLFDVHVPILVSLPVICGVVGLSIAASLLFPKAPETA